MIKLLKLFSGFIFFIIAASLIVPFFIDKQKFIKLAEEKIKSELNADISFDEDIGFAFLPFPTLKINSLKYSDKKIDLKISKVNISVKWSSIFDLKPEVNNMELFYP